MHGFLKLVHLLILNSQLDKGTILWITKHAGPIYVNYSGWYRPDIKPTPNRWMGKTLVKYFSKFDPFYWKKYFPLIIIPCKHAGMGQYRAGTRSDSASIGPVPALYCHLCHVVIVTYHKVVPVNTYGSTLLITTHTQECAHLQNKQSNYFNGQSNRGLKWAICIWGYHRRHEIVQHRMVDRNNIIILFYVISPIYFSPVKHDTLYNDIFHPVHWNSWIQQGLDSRKHKLPLSCGVM